MTRVDGNADGLGYSLITPARDEADNLPRLARSIVAQTVRPDAWIVVDSGSTDSTVEIVRELAARFPWIRMTTARGERTAAPGAPIVRAFHSGLGQLDEPRGIIVKLDADVSMAPDYFERLLAAFAADPTLGMAGGDCYELEDGVWTRITVTGANVRGAVRAYRWECLQQILPLPERTGWDTIDAFQATARGWRIGMLHDLRFNHHRSVGERDGAPSKRWVANGEGAYYVGYRPLYMVVRTLYRARRDPAAIAMMWGYARAGLWREPRHPDRAARACLRREQRLRNLRARWGSRVREADAGRALASPVAGERTQ